MIMKKYYSVSRIVISVLAVIISLIALINEDISFKVAGATLAAVVALVTSFVATPVSKRLIRTGDDIANKYLRALYYILILPVILLIVFVIYLMIMFIYDHMEQPTEFGAALSQALIVVFLYAAVFIAFIVPYIQTLIVLLLRKILKDKTAT